MRIRLVVAVVALVCLPLMTSCSGVRSGTAVKAAFDAEDQESWITKKIPGLKTLSNLLPPPNENRIKWDQYYKGTADPDKSQRRPGP